MMQIRTLILDDDPLWQQSLSKLVLLHPSLQLVGIGSNALEGYQILAEKAIDLLICDIEMPEWEGFLLLSFVNLYLSDWSGTG